ncbi:MAG: nuclear transport factor 2 family protein [Acidimicrobiia bacterium]
MSEAEGSIEQRTRAVVVRLYEAFYARDAAGMVETMSDDVWVRFLGRVDFRGKQQASEFFGGNNPLLVDLQFDIKRLVIDGPYAAAIWEESATTIHGQPYRNHGVDVFTVEDGRITAIHENNDIRIHREHFGS